MFNIFTPYSSNSHRNRRIDASYRISSTDTLCGFLKEVRESGLLLPESVSLSGYRIRTSEEANWVLATLNRPSSRFGSLRNIQSERQNWQRWDVTPSNLKKGYLFYFVCDGCDGRYKHLYNPDGQNRFLCRNCHKMSYPTKDQRERARKRLETITAGQQL